jgi:hypothetical protein
MRFLLILVLAGALALGGFLTKPGLEAQRKHANEVLAGKDGKDDIGDLIGDVLGSITRKDSFEDLVVATKYTATSGDAVLIECLGLFGQFLCSQPEKK